MNVRGSDMRPYLYDFNHLTWSFYATMIYYLEYTWVELCSVFCLALEFYPL